MAPPRAEASTDIRTRQIPALMPIVPVETPLLVHGLTAESPSPVPSSIRKSEKPADATPPAATALQDTAEEFDSGADWDVIGLVVTTVVMGMLRQRRSSAPG